MNEPNIWTDEGYKVLKYLHEDLKIFNWALIAKQLSDTLGFQVDAAECRNRYSQKYGPVHRGQWTPQQQKYLYDLHNQNGNKWAIIAQNLLGRNDNCVKNHFYSKLRKSLRTINKIVKLHLKKQAKQISDVVLYKLTQATDQYLKPGSDVSQQAYAVCRDLKNRLLQYQMDQKDIKQDLDYTNEKQLVHGLAYFNKMYKKKPKKQKITIQGTQNLKKRTIQYHKNNKKQYKQSKKILFITDSDNLQKQQNQFQQQSQNQFRSISNSFRNYPGRKSHQKLILKNYDHSINNSNYKQHQNFPCRSQSDYSIAKKTLNFLIKAPSQQQRDQYLRNQDNKSQPNAQKNQHRSIKLIPFMNSSPEIDPNNRVQVILQASGVLENGDYGVSRNYFRGPNSHRSSFSQCSDSQQIDDMFGQQGSLLLPNFKQPSELDNESQNQFFNNHQND